MNPPQAITLLGSRVKLIPMSLDQAEDFLEIGADDEIWTYMSGQPFGGLADARNYLTKQLEAQHSAQRLPFAVIDRASGVLAGTTSYLDIRLEHAGLEIGATWYSKRFRRSHVNTEAKLLLLTHAFEDLHVRRVQFLTDARNTRSQGALERIGAVKEGILRSHKVYPDGVVRDSAVYSIVRADWPSTKERIESLAERSA